ncbi:hypothetical protein C3L33_05561, partial [Rhododendron williamsianum]
MSSGNASGFKETLECQDMLENIAQILLGDTECASDEKKIMSKVNSLCCLLQDPTAGPSMKFDAETQLEGVDHGMGIQGNHATESIGDLPSCNQGLVFGHGGVSGVRRTCFDEESCLCGWIEVCDPAQGPKMSKLHSAVAPTADKPSPNFFPEEENLLFRPPLFFKETNPQPRSTPYGRHLQILLMDKPVYTGKMQWAYLGGAMLAAFSAVHTRPVKQNYERLIQCDKRLNLVSQQPDLVLDSPYFDIQASAKGSPTSSFDDMESTPAAQSSSKIGQNSAGLVSEHLLPQAPSPSSVMDLRAIEGNESRGGNSLQAQQSLSMSDLCPAASDEKKLMSRVNSLCCLLQDPTAGPSMKFDAETQLEGVDYGMKIQGNHVTESIGDLPSCNQGLVRDLPQGLKMSKLHSAGAPTADKPSPNFIPDEENLVLTAKSRVLRRPLSW